MGGNSLEAHLTFQAAMGKSRCGKLARSQAGLSQKVRAVFRSGLLVRRRYQLANAWSTAFFGVVYS